MPSGAMTLKLLEFYEGLLTSSPLLNLPIRQLMGISH